MKLTMILLLVLSMLLWGCMPYYIRQQEFHTRFQQGRLEEASQVLDKSREASRRRNRLLFLFNQGVVQHMKGNYAESNRFFEEAYILGEDFSRNLADEALALLANPGVLEYRGEDFEMLMIHFYKAMNFIQLGNLEAALVECRRMNIKLNALNDKHRGQNKYQRDAFIHNLMGIIYQAAGDYNNAFIAYRNAFEVYSEDYLRLFGLEPPVQLQRDIIRTAHLTGFSDQRVYFENKFGLTNSEVLPTENEGELVFFWQNGLGPVKEQWSINLNMVRGEGGIVHFQNEDLGLSFPFLISSNQAQGNLGDLRFVRVAFPRYVERRPVIASATLSGDGKGSGFELAQNINAIAFQSLQDRMLREFSTALLRLALKQAAEKTLRKRNEDLGALFGLVGAITEQADTRNWQTLPHSIHYTRMILPQGNNELVLKLYDHYGALRHEIPITVYIKAGQTSFINYHTLHSKPPGMP
ncbi:MAG TPA: hypothetical protein VLH37_06330 [Bacteroidales bacterium]|nr:hypothetical protein [Bacteroidales bacterium]